MKRGDIVIAKLYGGSTAERRVIRCYAYRNESKVVICNEEEWQAALQQNREPEGIGFPAEDITEIELKRGEIREAE